MTKQIWGNKIYSDDFDVDSELLNNKKSKQFVSNAINMAIKEDTEQSEMENPYFSDNSSSSHLTTRLRKFSLELSKYLDKSDNESHSVRSVGGPVTSKGQKLSHYHSNVNETIEEVEDEKEEHHE